MDLGIDVAKLDDVHGANSIIFIISKRNTNTQGLQTSKIYAFWGTVRHLSSLLQDFLEFVVFVMKDVSFGGDCLGLIQYLYEGVHVVILLFASLAKIEITSYALVSRAFDGSLFWAFGTEYILVDLLFSIDLVNPSFHLVLHPFLCLSFKFLQYTIEIILLRLKYLLQIRPFTSNGDFGYFQEVMIGVINLIQVKFFGSRGMNKDIKLLLCLHGYEISLMVPVVEMVVVALFELECVDDSMDKLFIGQMIDVDGLSFVLIQDFQGGGVLHYQLIASQSYIYKQAIQIKTILPFTLKFPSSLLCFQQPSYPAPFSQGIRYCSRLIGTGARQSVLFMKEIQCCLPPAWEKRQASCFIHQYALPAKPALPRSKNRQRKPHLMACQNYDLHRIASVSFSLEIYHAILLHVDMISNCLQCRPGRGCFYLC